MDRRTHWQRVHETKAPDAVSWYREAMQALGGLPVNLEVENLMPPSPPVKRAPREFSIDRPMRSGSGAEVSTASPREGWPSITGSPSERS